MISDPSRTRNEREAAAAFLVFGFARRVATRPSARRSLTSLSPFQKQKNILSQETMNELLNSAEFLVHVAVPGAVAKPGVTAGGAGDAPSWDVEGGGACVPVPARLFPFSRFFFRAFWRARRVPLVEDYFHSKKHHLSDLMSMSVNAMYE
jgi:hypothetical protein